ncbi:MAG: hypothetical protein OXF11_00115 [Deltaproteobacteria bacterium]|nr:hypothetical protein [Deltaproteobacteria bacterium]
MEESKEDPAMGEDDAEDGLDGAGLEGTTDGERPDLYYHGIIRRLSHRKNNGVVRTASGRDVRFSYQMVRMSGPVTSPKGLKEGMVVGYDLGWTGHGLRVTRIRTYPRPERDVKAPAPAPSEATAAVEDGPAPAPDGPRRDV